MLVFLTVRVGRMEGVMERGRETGTEMNEQEKGEMEVRVGGMGEGKRRRKRREGWK